CALYVGPFKGFAVKGAAPAVHNTPVPAPHRTHPTQTLLRPSVGFGNRNRYTPPWPYPREGRPMLCNLENCSHPENRD
ncbi:MAG: hypothetical protein VST67_14550, partial [Nitrospirota bacterium]|nr:hypothetical protein [Nitrospirota bacterium]